MADKKENDNKITLIDDDNKEIEFELLTDFDFEGNTYLALVPEEDNKDGDYVILKVDNPDAKSEDWTFSSIEDDDEFDRIADYFEDTYLSEIDYDEEN